MSGERRRRGRAVVQAIPLRTVRTVERGETPLELSERVLFVERAGNVVEQLLERLPFPLVELSPRELFHGDASVLAERVVVPAAPGVPHDGEPLGQAIVVEEVVERRQDLPARQVSRRAEDHERLRTRTLEPHRSFTPCPPNCCRSAAISFIANGSSSRESKRANSESAIAGTGTPLRTASRTVQRPSPESST